MKHQTPKHTTFGIADVSTGLVPAKLIQQSLSELNQIFWHELFITHGTDTQAPSSFWVRISFLPLPLLHLSITFPTRKQ